MLVHWSAARNKARFSSCWYNGYQPLLNRLLCLSIVLQRISLVRASEETFRRFIFDALEGTGNTCLVDALSCRHLVRAWPRLAASPCASTRLARGMSRFWIRHETSYFACSCFRRVIGLQTILLVRASGGRSEYFYSMPWRAQGVVVSMENRFVGFFVGERGARPCKARRR